jgi:hypothetical protein
MDGEIEGTVITVWIIIRIVWVRNAAAAIRTLALVEYVYVSPNTLSFGASCLYEDGP